MAASPYAVQTNGPCRQAASSSPRPTSAYGYHIGGSHPNQTYSTASGSLAPPETNGVGDQAAKKNRSKWGIPLGVGAGGAALGLGASALAGFGLHESKDKIKDKLRHGRSRSHDGSGRCELGLGGDSSDSDDGSAEVVGEIVAALLGV